jgi:hypothetical protein
MKVIDNNVIAFVSKGSDSKSNSEFSFNSSNNHRIVMYDGGKNGIEIEKSNSISDNVGGNSEMRTDTVKYNVVSDPYNELSKIKDVIIKIEYKDVGGCLSLSNNLFNVFTKNKNNIKYLFRSKELRKCTDYSLCQYCKRPFSLNIEHVSSIGEEIKTEEFATAEKIGIISCFCFCRPEIEVMLKNKDLVGTIEIPCSFGDTKYTIFAKEKKLKYIIDTGCFQSGMLCPKNCCGCKPEVYFDIYDDKYEKDGIIERKPEGFKEFMYVLDCYQIIFPKKASVEDKLLIICTAFIIEYQIFRNKWNCSVDGCYCEDPEECCAYCGDRFCIDCLSNCIRC